MYVCTYVCLYVCVYVCMPISSCWPFRSVDAPNLVQCKEQFAVTMNWTLDDAVILLVDWNDMTSLLFE